MKICLTPFLHLCCLCVCRCYQLSGIHQCWHGYNNSLRLGPAYKSVGMQSGWLDGLIEPCLELSNPHNHHTHTHIRSNSHTKNNSLNSALSTQSPLSLPRIRGAQTDTRTNLNDNEFGFNDWNCLQSCFQSIIYIYMGRFLLTIKCHHRQAVSI